MTMDPVARLASDILGRQCAPDVVARAAGGWSGEVWAALRSAGLTSLGADPASGGWSEIAAVVRQTGRYAAPVPLAEHVLALRTLARAGLAGEVREPLTVAPVVDAEIVTAEAGEVLRGTALRVPYARIAAGIVVVVPRAEGGTHTVLVPASSADLRLGSNLASEPRDDVTFSDLRLSDLRHALVDDAPAVLAEGALLRAVQIAGALDRVLELTVEYARVREQFGRPISRFQAVQQSLARLAAESAAASAAADAAVRGAAQSGRAVPEQAAAAKVRAALAATEGARLAHQIHGAVGMTEEHQLHRFTTRLLSWRDEFGTERAWAARLGAAMAAAHEGYWERLTADLSGAGDRPD